MAEEHTHTPGTVVHVEIPSADTERMKAFYGDVFGWTFQDIPELNYTLWRPAAEPGGGFYGSDEPGPRGLRVYLLSEDIEATVGKIEAAGGKIVHPKTEIPETGWFAFFEDPAGNVIGLYESGHGH